MLLKNYKNNKGFTLIELLVAMSIISIIIFSFFKVVNVSIKQNSKNEKDIKSLNVAQSEIESLRQEIKSNKNEDENEDENEKEKEIVIYNKNDTKHDIKIYKKDGTDIKIYYEDLSEIQYAIKLKEDKIIIYKSNTESTNIPYKDLSEIQYTRNIDKDNTDYVVRLNLSREERANRNLYNIEVRVKPEGSLSKKEQVLRTSVLSKQ